ncbi:MAG: S-adenosylmethionine tRNA ribosyltransferase [Ignavibacteriae bacterium HGW-Ignavibacteriae-4]|jgi:S-adenosylmethionine:tRNA ribosyltransferase-isomerase|nr:MAG: S-adenosylmethionine tRNA ribosyltransferase [Ignavibacteriae bacterium HGW-Ignavibacteriae-4]
MLPNININDFNYELPENRIAKYPLENRSKSKLLVANSVANTIVHHTFEDVVDILPENTSLYINKTKVISGRFYMVKETGGRAELLLVEPIVPSNDPQIALQASKTAVWKAIIGGKRIKVGAILEDINGQLTAEVLEKEANEVKVRLTWEYGTFSELLLNSGVLPLPPYLNRESEEADKESYQTVFAKDDGSIAAPTAGLHFTDEILSKLKDKGIKIRELTLHVGPGTFLPVSTDNVNEHKMHSEMFSINKSLLEDLKQDLEEKRIIVCVGTTSIRTLESLFWAGNYITEFTETSLVNQWSPYGSDKVISPIESLNNLINSTKDGVLQGKTELIIVPGYEFRFVNGLFTNYHVPKSTLLLLVSAFVGDMWTDIYKSALDNNYRFLSYGDSSLLWR